MPVRLKIGTGSPELVTTAAGASPGKAAFRAAFPLPESSSEAERRHQISALVLDDVRAFHALESGLGVFIAERCGFFVIGLGRGRILRTPSPALRKCTHSFHGAGMVLRSSLFKQRPRGNVVFRPADTVRDPQPELILGFRRFVPAGFRHHALSLGGSARRWPPTDERTR